MWSKVERTVEAAVTAISRVRGRRLAETGVLPIISITLRRVIRVPLFYVWREHTRLHNALRKLSPGVLEVDYQEAILDILARNRRNILILVLSQVLLRAFALDKRAGFPGASLRSKQAVNTGFSLSNTGSKQEVITRSVNALRTCRRCE